MKTKTVTLPSGREVKIKEPTMADLYRIQGCLPDYGSSGEGAALSSRDSLKLQIKSVCVLTVEPKFWADLRDEEEQDRDPRECPKNRTEFDLEHHDFVALVQEITKVQEEAQERARPLLETETA